MTYNFNLKPNKKLFGDVCSWLEQHIDKYALTEKPDRNVRIYTSSVSGKTAVVRFLREGVSVESEDDMSEYFNKFNKRVNGNYRTADRAALLKTIFILLVSLAFHVFNANALIIGSSLMWDFDPGLLLIAYCALFFLTFKPIYKITGEDTLRTAFIQSGGIFTVSHIAFLIGYAVCQIVNGDYVSWSCRPTEHYGEFYDIISEFIPFHIMGYFIVLLPWFISFIFYCIFPHMLERLKKNPNESVLSLIFFILCWGGSYAAGEVISAYFNAPVYIALIFIWAVFFAVFFALFKSVFVSIGERPGRTLFVMSGGVFTVIFGIIALLNEAPGREHWHEMTGWRKIIDLMGFSYFRFIPLPLIIAIAVGISSYHKKAADTEN